jgi:restriction system protein
MSWQEFEMLVGEAFRAQGYAVMERGGTQADGGVDLVLRKGSETFLVQCKQWKAFKVGVEVVRQLYGVMASRGAAGGFVITSGTFTEDAKEFADGRNVRLIDGARLFGLIQQGRLAKEPRTAPTPSRPTLPNSGAPSLAPFTTQKVPQCPVCAATMVRRTARKGPNAGSQFWGCARFPECRGTR